MYTPIVSANTLPTISEVHSVKKILVAMTFALCTAMNQAAAVPVTVEYKAVAIWIYERHNTISVPVQNTTVPGFAISTGETITGYLTYDTETPMEMLGEPDFGFYYLLRGEFQQSLKFHNRASPITFNFDTDMYADAYTTPFVLGADGQSDSTSKYRLRSSFEHGGHYPAWAGGLPTASDWDGFGGDSYVVFEALGRTTSAYLKAQITSFRVVSAVPEPSTYLMLGAGLGMIALARRSRRTPPTVEA